MNQNKLKAIMTWCAIIAVALLTNWHAEMAYPKYATLFYVVYLFVFFFASEFCMGIYRTGNTRGKGRDMKRTIVLLSIILLSLFTVFPVVSAFDNVATETHDGWTVTWTEIGQMPFVYIIEVQNLLPDKRDIELTTIFDSTNFDISDLSVRGFYEWKNVSYIVTVPIYDIVEWWNGTSWVNSTVEVDSYEETRYRLDWKACKMQTFERTAQSYRENMGSINIPKYGSKPKDDGTRNGTKWFQLVFDAPLVHGTDGWRSYGRVAMNLGEAVFDPWWDVTWTKRVFCTVDNSASSENLINFTVMVNVIYDADMQADFDDIRFMDEDDATVLFVELEDKTDNTEAWTHVKTPQLDAGDASEGFYMYYGNAGASSSWSTSDAWHDNYELVVHFDETSGVQADSSVNSLDLTAQGSPDQDVPGQIDGASHTDGAGSGDAYERADDANLDCTGDWSVMWLGNVTDTGGEGKLLTKRNDETDYPLWDLSVEDNSGHVKWYLRHGAFTILEGTTDVFDEWTLVHGVRDNSINDELRVYVNGTSDVAPATDNSGQADLSNSGKFEANAGWWNGIIGESDGDIDEGRVFRGILSAEWIEAEYLNVFGTWLTFGSEETTTATQYTTNTTTVMTTVTTTSTATFSELHAYATTVTTSSAATTVYSTSVWTTTITSGTSVIISVMNTIDGSVSYVQGETVGIKGGTGGSYLAAIVILLFSIIPAFAIIFWRRRRRR